MPIGPGEEVEMSPIEKEQLYEAISGRKKKEYGIKYCRWCVLKHRNRPRSQLLAS